MAKSRKPLGFTDFSVARDGHSLLAWVHVNQDAMGWKGETHCQVTFREHIYSENDRSVHLAKYEGENTQTDMATLIRLLRQAIDAAEKAHQLEQERESRSN